MKDLYLSKGVGFGKTRMAAYCNALKNAGIVNVNIIKLSSVIPPNFKIINQKPIIEKKDFGKKLFGVISEIRVDEPGVLACAGIGWALAKDGSGHGIMVEICGNNEEKISFDICQTLKSSLDGKDYDLENIFIETTSILCKNKPVCALISVSFKIEGWD